MPVVMEDVAARAGVSATTVSHVLNETRTVAPQTRRRVLEAVRELNYYTNASARLLVRGRADAFGLIISDIENPFFPELIKSFERACLERRMGVLLCTTNYDPEQARNGVRRMLESKVKGVAVMTSQLDPELIEEMAANETPIVLLDGPPARRARSNVNIDYSHGAEEAIRHLHERGHRRIALIPGPANRISAVRYKDALLAALAKFKLSPVHAIDGNNLPEDGATMTRELLARSQVPSAIVCGNDLMAIGAMAAAFEAGLRVPEDISIVGADDIAFARYSHPPLTTVRLPRDQFGQAAFALLERMVRTKRRLGGEQTVATQLLVRQSTGPARKR